MADEWIRFLDDAIRNRRDMRERVDWWLKKHGWGMAAIAKPFLRPTIERIIQEDAIQYLIANNGHNLRAFLSHLGGMPQTPPPAPVQTVQIPQTVPCPAEGCALQIPVGVATCPHCGTAIVWS